MGLTPTLTAFSLSIGWGIRGNFGHEYGAMIPGALAAMAAVLLSGREDWYRRIAYFAFFGALGWSFGGSIAWADACVFTASAPVTPDGFRNIEKPFVFVAGSRDVTDHRRAAYDQIHEVLSDFGLGNECTPFMWDTEHENDPFTQSRSMQKHLPRPASEHCRGIIAVLGERIGLPLEESFGLRLLAEHERWTSLQKVRLLHPNCIPQ